MYLKKYSFTKNEESLCFSPVDKEVWAAKRPMDHFTGCGGWNPGGRGSVMPYCFRAFVPQKGIYAVTISIEGGEQGVEGCNLYSNRRNLIRRDITVLPGETFTYRYFCHVCEYIPVVGEPPYLDLSIYVSLTGRNARLSFVTIESAEAPTLFIAGDSLVADYDGLYPYNPITNGGSWGQNLLQYFDGLAISNQAHGGMTTNCFREDGHWAIVEETIRPGDLFMMEFGHNDQKRRNLKPFDQYAANIRWYIMQVKKKGAYPILVTPLSRVPAKDEDGYFDLLEDYAESCRKIGREYHIPVIDLHQHSFQLLCSMEEEAIRNYFNDTTHTNDYGALVMAEFVAGEIERQHIQPLCSKMNDYRPKPWIPDASLRPREEAAGAEKEEKPILSTESGHVPYEDCRYIPQRKDMEKAMAFGLLDPCIKFFHPFAGLPRGQFLYLFFKVVNCPKKYLYVGKYCDLYKYEFDAQNVQAAIEMGLIDETTTPNDRFRPDDALTGGELVSFMARSLEPPEARETLGMEECEHLAELNGLLWNGYSRDQTVTRIDCLMALVRLKEILET